MEDWSDLLPAKADESAQDWSDLVPDNFDFEAALQQREAERVVDVEESPTPETFGGTFTRLAKDSPSLLKGSIDQVGVGWGQLLDFVGLDSAGTWVKEHYGQRAEDARLTLDPTTRAIQETPIYRNGEFDFSHIGEKAFTGAVSSSAQLIETLAPTTVALKGLQAIKGAEKIAKVAAKLGFGTKAAEYIGNWMTRGVAAGGSEGLSAGLNNSAQTESSIRKAPIEQLQQLDAYQEIYNGLADQGLSEVDRQTKTRDELANAAALRVFLQTAAATGTIGMVTGGGVTGILGEKMAGKAIAREVAKDARTGAVGFLKNVGQGALEETAQETPQSAAETYIQNLTEKKYLDETIDPTQNVVNAAIEGGLAGGLLGAVGGGAGHFVGNVPPTAPQVTEPRNATELKAKLVSEVADLRAKVEAQKSQSIADSGVVEPAAETTSTPDADPRNTELRKVEAGITRLTGYLSKIPADSTEAAVTQARTKLAELQAQRGQLTSPTATETPAPVQPTTTPTITTPVDEAAHAAAPSPTNDLVEPTEGQKQVGNYKKGHTRIAGLDISVENPQGSVRKGVDETGRSWETPLTSHYGYVKRTSAADGGKLDVFVKPGTEESFAGPVFVVNQAKRDGSFDEHKAILGVNSLEEANALYDSNYEAGWDGRDSTVQMTLEEFKTWTQTGDMTAEAPGAIAAPRELRVPFEEIPEDLTVQPVAGEPVNAREKLQELNDSRELYRKILECVRG